MEESGLIDAEGNRLFKNTDSNGRFHSDWCSMIYSRLMLARNLLLPDGIICISMDDNEETNLKNICNEVFNQKNCIGEIIRKTKSMTADNGNGFNLQHEILLIYAKDASRVFLYGEQKEFANYSNPDNDPNGDWCTADPSARSGGDTTYFGIENPYTHRIDYPPVGRYWAFSKSTMEQYIATGRMKFKTQYGPNERGFIFKRYKNNMTVTTEPVNSLFALDNEYMNQAATIELKKLFEESYFSYPKPVEFIKKLVQYTDADVIMDFFSGSGTTAHAVMQLSAEDGKKRNYIMVQLPEALQKGTAPYNAGYRNLCEIGRERIRRAAKKIAEEIPGASFDSGFRVFKLDESNMKGVFYAPADYDQDLLSMLESNIKEDRTDLDLLFGSLLEWGLPLSMPYTSEEISGCTVHTYNDGDLIACFDENIPDDVVKTIAKRQPLRAVFRDSSFSNSPSKINVGEIFKLMAPDTRVKVI